MGKIVSAVANFATKVVVSLAEKLGPVGTIILGALMFGPIGLITILITANLTTGEKIIKLKEEIAKMINDNQSTVDKAQELQQILERSFFNDQAFEYILKLGEELRTNLEMVFQDQRDKINSLKRISFMNGLKADDFNTSGQRLGNMLTAFMDVASLVLDGVAIVSGNPLGIAMAAIDIGLMTFSNITKLFDNIKEIAELEKTKAELETYLKPGGEFDRQMKEIVGYAVAIVKNLCTICYFWNSLVNELTAWVQIFQAINPTSQTLKFESLTKNLLSSPISLNFMNKASILEQDINRISNSNKKDTQKLEEVFKVVKKFEDENPIEETFAKISLVLKDFTEDAPTFNLLRRYIFEYSDINFFIDSSKHLFVRNNVLDLQRTPKQRDQQILDLLRERVIVSDDLQPTFKQDLLNGKLMLVIAACTEKFYAEDSNGLLIFGYKISELRAKANYVRFLGLNTSALGSSIIEQPEPLPGRTSEINRHKQVKREMIKRWNRQVIESQLVNYKLYLRMEAPAFKIGGVSTNRIQLIRVIQDKSSNKFEVPNQTVMLSIYRGIDNHDIWPPPEFTRIWAPMPMFTVMKQIGMLGHDDEEETDDEMGSIITTKISPYNSYTDVVKHTSLSIVLEKGESFLRAYTNPNTLKEVKIDYTSATKIYTFSVANGASRTGLRYIYRSTLVPLDKQIKMDPNFFITTNVFADNKIQKIVWFLTA